MMDLEKDFVVVRARLYLGTNYETSPKRAEAHKQGKLTELDKVETRAKAVRDFGVGTEHALDMDDDEASLVEPVVSSNTPHAVKVVEAGKVGNGHQPPKPEVKPATHTVEHVKASFLKVYKGETRWEPFKVHTLGLPVPDKQLKEVQLAMLNGKIVQVEREIQQRKAAKAASVSHGHESTSKA